jgi:hypothetical protein
VGGALDSCWLANTVGILRPRSALRLSWKFFRQLLFASAQRTRRSGHDVHTYRRAERHGRDQPRVVVHRPTSSQWPIPYIVKIWSHRRKMQRRRLYHWAVYE